MAVLKLFKKVNPEIGSTNSVYPRKQTFSAGISYYVLKLNLSNIIKTLQIHFKVKTIDFVFFSLLFFFTIILGLFLFLYLAEWYC